MPETVIFNPNELLFRKIRFVEEFYLDTHSLKARYLNCKDPSLQLSAEGTTVTDAFGSEIATFYDAQTGTFSFTNALFSLSLLESQFGTKRKTGKLAMPVSETLDIGNDHTVKLKYVPVGEEGAEIKEVTILSGSGDFAGKYQVSSTAGADKFTIDADNKTITFPESTTGKVIVNYFAEKDHVVQISKTSDSIPEFVELHIHCWFTEKCDPNIMYPGVIVVYRTQIDPSSIDIGLTPDGGHAASYKFLKDPCAGEDTTLLDVFVSKD